MLRFEYLYIGLPALSAGESREATDKKDCLRLALSAFMKSTPEYRRWLATEGLRTIVQSRLTDQEKFLLCDCVEVYLPLTDEEKAETRRILETEPYKETLMRNASSYDQGVEKGIEKGRAEGVEIGERNAVRKLLEARFGLLGQPALNRLEALSRQQLDELFMNLLTAKSLSDLGLAN